MSNGLANDNTDLYSNSSHAYPNNHPHLYNSSINTQQHPTPSVPPAANAKNSKPRKRRKADEAGTSFEDETTTKVRKRKSKWLHRVIRRRFHRDRSSRKRNRRNR